MAVLTEGELLLKEQIELQKGISKTNDEFKQMLSSSKQYQQMLRAINRQLVEHNTNYGKIREENEEIFDTIFNYSKLLKDQKLSSEFNNIYKNINKISDEFRDLNSQLQTGDISLKQYQKSFDKLSNVQKSIDRQKNLLDFKKSAIEEELKADEKMLKKKENALKRLGGKTKDELLKELNTEIKIRDSQASRIKGIQDRLSNTSYVKRDVRASLTRELDKETFALEKRNEKISNLQKSVKKSPTKIELSTLEQNVGDKKRELEDIEDVNKALDKSRELTQRTSQQFVNSRKEIEAIDKKIGNIGRTMGVLQEFGLNRIFDFKAVEDAMQSAAREEYLLQQQRNDGYDVTIKKFGVLRAGAKAVGGELMGKFGVVGAVGGGMWLTKQIADLFFMIDERTTNIAKNHNVTRMDAESILASYSKMAIANEKISVYGQQIAKTSATQKELLEASLEISQLFGVNYSIVNKQEGDLIANIKNRMGLSDDVRQSMLEGSMVANEGFEDYFDKILGVNAVNRANNKFYMNDKALLMDMAKTSSSIRLQFRNHSMDLAQIVINSKKYGTNLQQLDSSMGGMIDWQSQLEAQTSLFSQTGRLIDTSRLQYYAMYNDMENYQKEFDKLLPSVKEYEGYTRYAQQTVAEMFGFDRDSMAQMYIDKEVMKKINADERAKKEYDYRQTEIQMKKEYDALKEKGLSYETITKILGHNSQILLSDISSAEDFSRALEKIKDTFATFVNKGGVEKLVDAVTGMTQNIHQFLEKWGDVLGIRSKTNVLEKYDTSGIMDNGVYDLAKALSENKKNPSLNIEERKDFEYIAKEYQQQYKISDERFQEYSNNLEKTLQNYKNLQSYDKIGLEEVMNDFSRKFYESSLPKGVLSNELPVGGKFLNKNIKSMNDGMISPRGNIVIKTPEGQIMPNPKDYLIATTNPNSLFSKNPSQNITQYLIDDTKIISTMEMVRKAVEQSTVEIVKAVSQNKDVNLNGRKVGEMINMSNNRI